MAINQQSLTIVFGVMGNIISFLVCLAPLPTFFQIYKRKSSEGFQSIPYVIALFSAMLWIYYGLLTAKTFLIVINSFCCVIETIYIVFYFFYAPKKDKILTAQLVLLFNVFGFGAIFLCTFFLAHGQNRDRILGYICMAFALSVFVAPLCIIGKVIRTKSVEFMPFYLSFFLTLGAVMWFFYGLLLKDRNIALPNVVGFVFGLIQMVLYIIYKNPTKKVIMEEPTIKLHDISEHIVDVVRLSTMVCSSEMRTVVPQSSSNMEAAIEEDEEIKKEIEKIKKNKDASPVNEAN